ncbi:MAG: adenylate/guanylate cyclase domain-containing protein [Alphaproteobacteria bacterium]|nr:adenylate/guanylate cyclase domain-containing protein [Alphaproteobacteria bacterium]
MSPPSPTPFQAARQANERWVAAFFVASSLLFAMLGLRRLLAGEQIVGLAILGAAAFTFAVYAHGFVDAGRRPPSMAALVFRTTTEALVPTVFVLIQGRQDATVALQNAPVILWVIPMFISVLRLQPRLSLVAGGLAAGGWLACWALLGSEISRTLPGLGGAGAVERSVLLLICGVLAWRIGASMTSLVARVGEVAAERERVRHAFGAYVAEPVVERVLSGDLSLSTERRVISVLFVDIRGFTAYSADRTPTEVLDRLNTALEAFSVEVRRRDGIVNKFLGDGLMAIFGAPLDEPDHARNAAQAAVAIARVAQELDRSGAYPGLRIGVGLHCGEVVVGDIGGRGHREYTAIGDVVNTASRVEGVTKDLDETVLVTRAVVEALGEGFTLGPGRPVSLRGKTEPVELFALRDGPATG